MNTFEEYVIEFCVKKGMFENQAKEVLKAMQDAPDDPMKTSWQNRPYGYPDVFYNVLHLSINTHAIKWIEKNLPLAWFKPMFSGGK